MWSAAVLTSDLPGRKERRRVSRIRPFSERQQRVEAESLLVGGFRVLFLTVGGRQQGVDIDDYGLIVNESVER